jgi:hypothetical protein
MNYIVCAAAKQLLGVPAQKRLACRVDVGEGPVEIGAVDPDVKCVEHRDDVGNARFEDCRYVQQAIQHWSLQKAGAHRGGDGGRAIGHSQLLVEVLEMASDRCRA